MKKTLVFGASLKPNRYSYYAIQRLVANGIKTEAFGIREGIVSGVKVSSAIDNFSDIHTISLYLNPDRQKQYYQEIIELKPKRVLFNPGTENPEFYSLLQEKGIEAEEACTLVLLSTGQY